MDKKRLLELAGILSETGIEHTDPIVEPLFMAVRNAIAQGMNEAGVAIPTTPRGDKAVKLVFRKVWDAIQKFERATKANG